MNEVARQYLAAGLCVLPARTDKKFVAKSVGSWKRFQSRLPTVAELDAWLANGPDGLCLICGAVSGNLEAIDFDLAGEVFEPWRRMVQERMPDLLERLVVERSPSGGWHVYYRGDSASGSIKLAQRKHPTPDGKLVTVCGKEYKPRRDPDGNWSAVLTLIETRGEGGLILCAPTPGYEIVQGDLCQVPVITAEERDILLQCAWELNEYVPPVINGPKGTTRAARAQQGPTSGQTGPSGCLRPGDDYGNRGDVRAVLEKHGWRLYKGGDNEHWTRPGKQSGTSATLLEGRVFYVFTSSADPFEPNQAYSPFAVYTLLEHGGNWGKAARELRLEGYGGDPAPDASVDLSAIVSQACSASMPSVDPPPNPGPPDPGPLPEELLRVPGFIGEVMDHCLATAPYPSQVMAFCGGLSLQSLLAGRKVRDPGDNRTNLYLLGLAHSSAGKDWPRRINTDVLHSVGMADCLANGFASGEGIQDALFLQPAMLFQTDEIDGMLQSINKSRDARHEGVMSTLLIMHSAASSVFPMRRKAGKESPGVIDQPCLSIFGTAIPKHYYEALSERMLTNGFFARMIIVEAGPRGTGQEPSIRDLPPRVLATAKWWSDFQPGEYRGNLLGIHPVPKVVEQTDEAKRLLIETRLEAEAEYSKAESGGDPVGTTVWGRVSEHVRKLSLIYAVSEDHLAPRIGVAAIEWASRLVMHQTRRMLFMAAGHVAENPFHAECLKVMQKLRDAPNHELRHQVLLKRMKMEATRFRDLMQTLITQGDVHGVPLTTPGRTGMVYRLADAGKEDTNG